MTGHPILVPVIGIILVVFSQSVPAKFINYFKRSGFKIPDQVQGQGVRPIGKAQHTRVCEHLPEACNVAIEL